MKFQTIGLLGALCFAMSLLQFSACTIEDEDCRDFGCPEGTSCNETAFQGFECVETTPTAAASGEAAMMEVIMEDESHENGDDDHGGDFVGQAADDQVDDSSGEPSDAADGEVEAEEEGAAGAAEETGSAGSAGAAEETDSAGSEQPLNRIGSACFTSIDCNFADEGLFCYDDIQDGYCTSMCTNDSDCGTGAACYNGYCFARCQTDRDCRGGVYACLRTPSNTYICSW